MPYIDKQISYRKSININRILSTVTFGYYLISAKQNIYKIIEILINIGYIVMAHILIKQFDTKTYNEYISLIGNHNRIKYRNHLYPY